MENIEKFVKNKCYEHGVELLYLTKFGSHLYGTDTPESDTDYKGIFLPSLEQCILGQQPKSLDFSTGKNDERNDKDDVDISLWSLQYFMELVSKGETNALDILYSPSHIQMIEYIDIRMDNIFRNYDKLFNIKDCNAFVGYAISQAKKYGIKGSRLGAIKKVNEYLEKLVLPFDVVFTLDVFLDDIVERCYDSSYCFKKTINEIDSLVLCGKVHQGNISIVEFCERIKNEYTKYGDRAKKAERNEGLDWKAISHAVRSLEQMMELIETGRIVYPLKSAERILKIKNGGIDFTYVSNYITNEIDDISEIIKDPYFVGFNKKDQKYIDKTILKFYI